MDFALEHPENVRSLTLVGPGISGYALSAEHLEKVNSIFTIALTGDYEDFIAAYLADPALAPRSDRSEARELVRAMLQDNRRMFDANPSLAHYAEPPAATRLATVRAPTHIIVAGRDDAELHRMANVLRSGIEGSETTTLDECGHLGACRE